MPIEQLWCRARQIGHARRLFFKIFLWFWFTILGVSTVVVAGSYVQGIHVISPPNIYATVAPILAAEAVDAYESEGPNGFARFAKTFSESNEDQKRRKLYLLNGSNQEVLGRAVSQDGLRMARQVRAGQILVLRDRIAVYRFISPKGHPYVFLLYVSSGFSRIAEIVFGRGMRFLLVLLPFVTLLCIWLARHIASPIYAIQAAARKVTQGDLTARAPARVLHRRDELASLATDFNSMVQRIELLMQAQKELLAMVSHELRSPLARLNVSVALLHRGSGAREQELLRRMERDIGVIDTLIGQLLTLSRFEVGVSGSFLECVDLRQLLEEVGADVSFEAQTEGKSVQLVIQDSACLGQADAHALRSACENIVRNAVRFTAPGTCVRIELKSAALRGSPAMSIAVYDEGFGVPPSMLETIFHPFVRVHSGDGSGTGNGLGLAIALGAVRLHRGSIVARNRDSGGLEVEVLLPLHTQDRVSSSVDSTSALSMLTLR